ncbi:dTDP-4-dehydrorhamnose reductase [Desulfovibrio sp. OttesenSCG-928-F07]|nr:dTDP-4-dehydrorhamnose reductase [Desulfovibrio sp. OttesenSCG-928-F07]
MNSTMPKAFVLGGQGGLLGRALTAALGAKGWDVVASIPGEFDYFAGDLYDKLSAKIDKAEPACIFNCVAYTNVEAAESNEEEAMVLNRSVPSVIARIVKERPTRLVHFSTDFVFDGRKTTPYTVSDSTNPLSAYGRTKLAGEDAINEAALERYNIIRTAWLFGSGKKNFVRTMLNICRERGEAKVVFDQIGSPTYALDLANYTLALVELEASGLFHIVNSGQASWCELAAEAANYSFVECQITPVPSTEFPSKVTRPAYSVLDTSSFTQITGMVPRAWPQALREYLMLDDVE